MIEFDKSRINGFKCVSVEVNHHFHGPTHRPRVSANIVYLVDGKPSGQVTVDNFEEALSELAHAIVSKVEEEFAAHIGADDKSEKTKQTTEIKGLVKEF